MTESTLANEISDRGVYEHAVQRFREAHILLPRFSDLADPEHISPRIRAALGAVDPDAAHPLNLFRVHWWNDATRRGIATNPEYVVLEEPLTGVPAPIIVALGDRFPMIRAHKVLAAYACLAPRIVSGAFDPQRQRAVWPSTGNYCRGGVAISRVMRCRGVAVLPEGMSAERFRWLARWVQDPSDIVRTPGSESNVKEIYDTCAEMSRDPANVILNQFAEYGNHLAHMLCTGRALSRVFESVQSTRPGLELSAFVSATGSAGAIAAGDTLKERTGCRIVAVEALECPTLLENGYGSHNIQGIGDKHVPLIHNVMNTDMVVAVSDQATDGLDVLFQSKAGHDYLARSRRVPADTLAALSSFGLSSVCNIVAAVKVAKHLGLGREQAIVTLATDGADMYGSERERTMGTRFSRGFDAAAAAETFGRWMLGAETDHLLELTTRERHRIFNLGYYTWVEQQGITLEDFEARRRQEFWSGLRDRLPAWDAMIEEFNRRTGVEVAP